MILILLLLAVLGILICVALVFQKDDIDRFTAEPSNAIVKTLAVSAIKDSEAYLDEDGINSLLAYLVNGVNEQGISSGDVKLKAAAVDINADKPCKVYFQVEYMEKEIQLSADISIQVTDESIKISFDNAYAGKLKIPRYAVTYILSKTNLQSKNNKISVDDLSVEIPSHYSLDIGDIGTLVNIDIIELKIDDNSIYIKTNPVVSDTIQNIFDIIGGDTFNDIKDKISGFFGEDNE